MTWLTEELGWRAEAHEVHLARLSQADAAAGLGTSVGGHLWLPAQLFGRRPAKALSVGWRQVASRTANTFWHGLKEHLVPLCGPTTEGQRMCFLAAAPWPGLSSPYGPSLTETQRIPPSFFRTYPKANTGLILLQLSGCRSTRPPGSSRNGVGGRRQGQASWFQTGRFRSGDSLCVAWLPPHPPMSLTFLLLLFPRALTTCSETTSGPHL